MRIIVLHGKDGFYGFRREQGFLKNRWPKKKKKKTNLSENFFEIFYYHEVKDVMPIKNETFGSRFKNK
jgi:hypothetical protein